MTIVFCLILNDNKNCGVGAKCKSRLGKWKYSDFVVVFVSCFGVVGNYSKSCFPLGLPYLPFVSVSICNFGCFPPHIFKRGFGSDCTSS